MYKLTFKYMITAWIRMNEITEAQVKLGPYF